jgi:hypothetical protein
MQTAPNCYKCIYFKITHHPKTPRACTWFGFSTPELPSVSLFLSTGQHCPCFEPRADVERPAPPQSGPQDGWIA